MRNGVIDLGSVEAPGTAKNCITIGASENYRPDKSRKWSTGSWKKRYPANPIFSDKWADNPNGNGSILVVEGQLETDVLSQMLLLLALLSSLHILEMQM